MTNNIYAAFADGHFAGRRVLITGAAGGMGRETARAFAFKGAEVLLCDRDADGLATAVQTILDAGGAAHAIEMNVGDPGSIASGFAEADRIGPLDTLVTCAAVITAKRIPDQDWAHWRKVLDVNLLGTFFCVQAAIERMRDSGGTIVCTASDAGVHGGGGLIADTAYAASKAGTLSLVKSVARELAGGKIRINALNPGPTDSPMHAHIQQDLKDRIAASLPRRRMGQPADMAAAILFLCSDAAPFMYGAALDVDGGSMFR